MKASDGWIHYFKQQHNIVDRHVDKTITVRSIKENEQASELIKKFRDERIPVITTSYARNKVISNFYKCL